MTLPSCEAFVDALNWAPDEAYVNWSLRGNIASRIFLHAVE
jgi:hypothetical protein